MEKLNNPLYEFNKVIFYFRKLNVKIEDVIDYELKPKYLRVMSGKSSIEDYADNIQETALAIEYERISLNLRLASSMELFKRRKKELDCNLIKLDYFMNLYIHSEEKSGRRYSNFYEFLGALKKKGLLEEHICADEPISRVLSE